MFCLDWYQMSTQPLPAVLWEEEIARLQFFKFVMKNSNTVYKVLIVLLTPQYISKFNYRAIQVTSKRVSHKPKFAYN